MKNLLLALLLLPALFSCSSQKLQLESTSIKTAENNATLAVQASTAPKHKVRFASMLLSDSVYAIPNTQPVTDNNSGLLPEPNFDASTSPAITSAMLVNKVIEMAKYQERNSYSAKEVKNWKPAAKRHWYSFRIFKKHEQQAAKSEVSTAGSILNQISFWFGLLGLIIAIFIPGLGIALGLMGLIFGIIGTNISNENKSDGKLGILLGAIAIVVGVIFGFIYDRIFWSHR